MKRVLLTVVGLILALAATANAVTPPKIVLSRVDPPIAAIRGGGGTTIEIRDPAEELILLDQQGDPFLRMTKDGAYERGSKGDFQQVRKENFFFLHDGHVSAAVVEKKSLPYPWRIAGTYGGKPFVMEGTLVPAGTNPDGSRSGGVGVRTLVLLGGLGVVAIAVAAGLAFAIIAVIKRR